MSNPTYGMISGVTSEKVFKKIKENVNSLGYYLLMDQRNDGAVEITVNSEPYDEVEEIISSISETLQEADSNAVFAYSLRDDYGDYSGIVSRDGVESFSLEEAIKNMRIAKENELANRTSMEECDNVTNSPSM